MFEGIYFKLQHMSDAGNYHQHTSQFAELVHS
jgi:hypothetical protein